MEVIAVGEGANISSRSIQRATIALGVVKTKCGLSGGWVWAMPTNGNQGGKSIATTDRAKIIADRLRKLEGAKGRTAPIYPQDPRVQRWAQVGISDPDLKEAYERATTDHAGMLTVGIMDRYVNAVMTEGASA